jgi:glucose-6-phosphate dehydrogenase assembly protein OpcA
MARIVAVRTWRRSAPDTIESDLSALWRDLARQAPMARAVMSNLLVFRERTAGRTQPPESIGEGLPLDEVVARHPSRVVLIEHERDRATCAPLAAGVGVVAFGPPHARYGVEHIAVQSACADASLPSILRRLVRGDLPTSVWWAEDLSQVAPVEAIVAMGRQFVFDSRQWRHVDRGVLALAPLVGRRGLDLADLNWRRLSPLRQALLHGVRSMRSDDLRHATIRLVYHPGEGALAWLLVGWLSARLEWPSLGTPTLEEARHGDDVLAILITGEADDVTATLSPHHVVVRHRSGPPFSIAVPHESEADAVAAELRTLPRDVCLNDTFSALLRRFSAA